MISAWKRRFGAAALLLLLGAGCGSSNGPHDPIEMEEGAGGNISGNGERPDDGHMEIGSEGSEAALEADADATVALILADADADTAAEEDENRDAELLTRISDDRETLDAYGRAHEEPAR